MPATLTKYFDVSFGIYDNVEERHYQLNFLDMQVVEDKFLTAVAWMWNILQSSPDQTCLC